MERLIFQMTAFILGAGGMHSLSGSQRSIWGCR